MTDYVDQWDMRVTKSNAMLADDVQPAGLAQSYPDLDPDQIGDLCNEAAMQAIGSGDTLIDFGHFDDAYAELGLGVSDEDEDDREHDDESGEEPAPEPHHEAAKTDGGAVEEQAGRDDRDDFEQSDSESGPNPDVDEDDVQEDEETDTRPEPEEMTRDGLEAEVAELRERVDEVESIARESQALVEAVRRQMAQQSQLLVGEDTPQEAGVDPEAVTPHHQRLQETDDRIEDVEDEVSSLDGVIADGGGGKASKVRDIVQMASNRRTNEAVIAMEVSDIVDATGVSRRYANDLIDGANSLPSEYGWIHERADLTQYGELELDKNAQNKALVIDFEGAQGPKCPVNKFTTGGR